MASEELPPGATWAEALAVIRQHRPLQAARLEHDRYLLLSRAWSPVSSDALKLALALSRLEAEALDLFWKLSQEATQT